ncbi:hypothetical protein NDU88_006201 [Pleurodeles waltl]|uniref:Uncharacterized protein n=1 Tax=Pleurodeles waltl TaxID=8319 RepID=A0AAV7TXN4_PLEWA|nr:hypothetical protein NDU88_006201 [Pleurodeles waltl]
MLLAPGRLWGTPGGQGCGSRAAPKGPQLLFLPALHSPCLPALFRLPQPAAPALCAASRGPLAGTKEPPGPAPGGVQPLCLSKCPGLEK